MWLKENEHISEGLRDLLGHTGSLVTQHGQAIVGLLGLLFGVWRTWKYREQILHKRLQKYLLESDWRLRQCRDEVLEAIQRPGPGQPAELPLFANDELRSVLRERNWDRTPVAASISSSAQWQISKAMEKIERQLKSGEQMIVSLREQLMTAQLLRGAIASSSADRTPNHATRFKALNAYRAAQAVPGFEQSVIAKELEAHELRKMRLLPQALLAYQALAGR